MPELARNSLVILSLFMLLGGIFGFVKAKSKASLIAGVISSIALSICFAICLTNLRAGLIGGLAVGILLDIVFAMRLVKTKKFMPSGMLLFLNLVVNVLVGIALATAGGANDLPG